ncbi:MAG TPA: amino acid adenylation domain-containing protein [Stellaceae bacterium]|nr:amino acid adenylation domain-containing protein [Stellaceae bacterium]
MSDNAPQQEELFELLLQLEGIDLKPASTIARRSDRNEAPLSFAQSRLWFLDQLDGPTPNYNMPGALRLDGELDVDALRVSLGEIRNRHDILRTRFVRRGDEPVQVIDPPDNFALPVVDLTDLNARDQATSFQHLARQNAVQPFDLALGPLLRLQLVRLEPRRHVLLFATHHIISDGWSIGVLIGELTVLYKARRDRVIPELPELAIQYADYAQWQHAHLTRESLEPSLAYWRERLAGAPEILGLPTDRRRPPVQTYDGGTHRFQIGPELTARLRQLSRQCDCTLFMVLQAGFAALLSRYNGSDDIVFGMPVANRTVAGIEPLIGFFANTLVLRTDLSGDPTVAELIARVRSALLGDLEHQELPFEFLVDELQPRRNLSFTPLIQAMLTLQNTPQLDLELPGLTVSIEECATNIAKFDITLALHETNLGLAGEIEYNTDLFDAETIRRMAGHFRNLLRAMAREPAARVSEVDFLSADEVELLLHTWIDTATDFPRDKCIQQLFEQQAAETPDVTALVFCDRQLTYAELNARANQVARHLRTLGVGPEVAVPIICERSIELIVGILGILKAGGAYVPLDPKYPADRLEYMFREVKSPVVLTHRACAGHLPQDAAARLLLDDDWPEFARESREDLEHHTQPDGLAYIIFTSGSTGRPKGVRVVHDGVVRLVKHTNYVSLSADEVILQLTPISFDVSTFEIWGSLLNGGRLVVPPPGIPSSQEIGRLIKDYGITTMWLTAGLFHLLVDENLEGLRPLRQLLAGGDVLSVSHCRRVLRELPELRLINGYGPTECTTFTTCCTLTEATIGSSVSIGRPISNTKVYILDEHRKLVPPGCAGELCAGGYGLARDYLNDPELTAEKFIRDPFDDTPGARLYCIGDLCRYLPDGNIEYLGRIDRQVKIRGFRIEPGEIETVLALHDAVRDCTVTARPDRFGNKRLIAYVVPTDTHHPPDEEDLRAFLSQRLPEFMVPAAFVTLDRLPLNPSGKIDRDVLPAPKAFVDEQEFIAPRTETERALAAIWSRLMGVSRVGIHDNFFAVGGHSLMAIRLVARIRDRFAAELPVRQVFELPTIAGLAEYLDGQADTREPRLPPIFRRPREREPLLSLAQQRLWFLYQLDPHSAAYNVSVALRLTGRLRIDLLVRCFQEIVGRHESLRTNFLQRDGGAVQVVHEQCRVELESRDLSALPTDERDSTWQQLAQAEALRPFELESDSLLRLFLIGLAENDQVLVVTMHHIISDGWSLGVLFDEFSQLYRAFAAGEPSPLDELRVQYADFAAWQRSWLNSDILQRQLAYWRAQLDSAPTLLELPTDRPRPAVQTYPGRTHLFEIDAELTAGLRQFSRESDSSQFMTLLAAYAAILSRYSGQDDIVVGSPVANRKHSDTEALIGFFANTLALRVDLSGDPTFRELLARVREMTLDAFAHDDLPLEQLVEELSPQRNLGQSPIFQTLFVLQNAPLPDLELPDLELTIIDQPLRIAKFDLTLTLEETDGRLRGEFEYNTDLFEADTISRLATHFERFLRDAVARPDQYVSRLQILSVAECERLLIHWNHGEIVDDSVPCVPQWFERQAALTPDATALVFDHQSWTYHELNAGANQLARFLRRRRIDTDIPVGLCLERSYEMVVAQLGVLKAGGAYVPLDLSYPEERLAFMIRDTGMSLLLTEAKWLARHPQASVESVCLDSDRTPIAGESEANLPTSPAPDDLAYIIYTSGSTGEPKGVMVPHRALANHMQWMQRTFAITSGDRVLQKTPFSFDASVWEFYLPLLTGGVLVLAKPDGHLDSEYLVEAIREHRVTVFQGVPSLLRMLVETAGYQDLDSLRYVFSGGEPLTADLRNKLFGASRTAVCNLYGPTEACIDATFQVCSRDETVQAGALAVPIGRPIQNATAYVLDEHQQPVPAGVAGELFLGGAPLARGYWNRPELTAEKFVDNPVGDGRLFKTGDRVRWSRDGHLEFLGRTDDQIKLRGFRIELGEIEAALRTHETVHDAAAVVSTGRPEDPRLIAFVQPAGAQNVSISELRSRLKDQMPEYMIPSAWAVLERLPRLPNGKINKAALPIEEAVSPAAQSKFAPATGTEDLLISIWTKLLNLPHIGPRDNFFDLGGHSLLATQLISRLRHTFSVDLPLRSVFEGPTVVQLARAVDDAVRRRKNFAPLPQIAPTPRAANLPLSFAQQRLWFLQQIDAGNPFYNMPMALEVRGPLDVAVLKRSINKVVQRHEALRTSFATIAGEPVQIVRSNFEVPFAIVDLGDLSAERQMAEIRRHAEAEALQVFDLSKDLLLRTVVLRLDDDHRVLLLTMHHIVSDGWSIGILVDELARLYAAFANNEVSPLAELPIQYADFAVWQRKHLASHVQDVQMSYWQRQLADAPFLLELPADHRRPAVHTFRGGQVPLRFDPDLSEQLRVFSRNNGVTLFMTLLAGFTALLARYTQQDDILVGTPIANRSRAEIEPLIGFFVNMLVLRTDFSDDPDFRELLRRTLRTTLDAYAHQDLPFEQLVEVLHTERDISRNPIVQVSFALQNAPMPPLEVEGLRLQSLELEAQTVRFDIEVHLWDAADGIEGYLLYYRDIFETDTVARFGRHFENLLRAALVNPDAPVSALPLLDADERQARIAAWGVKPEEAAPARCLHRWFEDQAERTPDAVAVVVPAVQDGSQTDTRQTLTYRELNALANQLAHCLRERGAGPEVLVGLCIGRSVNLIIGLLGILKAGSAYVPLDPDYPRDRLAFMLEDSRAPILVTESRYRDALPETSCHVVQMDVDAATITAYPRRNPASKAAPENVAYVIYTSGSTGEPKGVMVTHANVSRLFTTTEPWFTFDASDVWTLFHSCAFDFSVWELWGALLYGGQLVVVPYWVSRSPDAFRQLLTAEGVTVLNQTPSAFRQLVAADALARHQPLLLRHIILGGEALDLQSLRPWFDRHGDARPQLTNMFGITETTVHVTYRRLVRADLEYSGSLIGRPLPDLQLWLLDKHLEPLPVGVAGEIFVGGAGVARGYLDRPELDAVRFIANPFDSADTGRLYRTGDLARILPDGDLEYLGRIDDQVKIRGFRIELGEVEAVIRKHPAIDNAVLAVQEDEPGDKRLVAYLKADPSYAPEISGGHDYLVEYAAQWQNVFDESYGGAEGELGFNITGWNSSYTGQPIAAEEMREWVTSTCERILTLHPSEVLEIGCGTGLLLSRLARHCARYCGVDFSAVAVEQVNRLKAKMPALDHVTVQQRPAHDFSGIETESFDLVILNSVAQYFPNLDYLLQVLDGAVRLVRRGGHVFLGDLRSFPLLQAYHTSVQLFQAPDALPAAQLRQRIALRMAQEDELLLDPSLFFALQQQFPKIGGIRVLVKRGQYKNEMLLFRYDVVLSVGAETGGVNVDWINWEDARPSLADMQKTLQGKRPEVLAISAVPNARVQTELRIGAWLETAADDEPVKSLRGQLQETSGAPDPGALDPEALFELGDALGYSVEISWAAASPEGRFDVVFYNGSRPDCNRSAGPLALQPLYAYATNPLRRKLALELIPNLRRALQQQLPAYMVPSAFVMIDEFPLTANGKLDRRALPALDATTRSIEKNFVAPRTDAERILVEIWAEVLGLDQVGVTENFFELGGDSILSIQIVSRAVQAGLSLSPRLLFLHQTIEELAAVMADESRAQGETDIAFGEAPLTPIQHWFFEAEQPEPHYFNQAFLLETSPHLDSERLRQALLHLPSHHSGLRLRFFRDGGVWRQIYAEDDSAVEFTIVDWSSQSPDERRATLENIAAHLHSSLHLGDGPLMRAAHFQGAAGEPGRLLWIAHHLLVDGVSWRILLEDLETACQQLEEGKPITLLPATASFKSWAQHLQDYARSTKLRAEFEYWQNVAASPVRSLPSDGVPSDGAAANEASARDHVTRNTVSQSSFQLSTELTDSLLHAVPPVYRTRIDEILLTALVQTFADWGGERALLLDLEGHGREELFPDLDVARTIGWFTTIFPVRLSLPDDESPGEAIKSIKEQLRRVPKHGIGYGLLRYLADDLSIRASLSNQPQPEVVFNYLGQLDVTIRKSRYFRPAAEPSGPPVSPRYRRRHPLAIDASIISGRLLIEWTFIARRFESKTIGRLGKTYLDRLAALIEHCRNPGIGGFTPSDFAAARVGKANLDRLLSKLQQQSH